MKRSKEGSKASYGIALIVWIFGILILMPFSPSVASAAVQLNRWTAPASGVAGVSFVNLTGSGLPTLTGVSPDDVTISLSLTCGGESIATTTAANLNAVTEPPPPPFTGRSYRIQFGLPASLVDGNYFASISVVLPDGTTVVSNTCAQVIVTTPQGEGWSSLISRAWTVPPGATTIYKCRWIQVPTDMYITAFRAIVPSGTYKILLTVSDSAPSMMGDFDCPASSGVVGFKGFYGAGPGTNDLVFPPGVAVHLKAGQFVQMNLHLANSTAMALAQISDVQVQTATAADVTDEAEMIFAGTVRISIPSDGVTHTVLGGCFWNLEQDYHIFALWPHMHSAGTRMKLEHGKVFPPDTVLDTPYTVDSQLVYPVTPPVTVSGPSGGALFGDQVLATCSYVNNTGHTLTFGDGSDKEQCFMGIYRYPVIPVGVDQFGHQVGTLLECMTF